MKKILPPLVIGLLLASLGIAGWQYTSRPPLLVVTDASFSQLYGPRRLRQREASLSASFFRQVIPVFVDESAASEIIAFAVEDAFEEPWAVVFPSRYTEGARRYREMKPETPVLVMGGTPRPDETGISFARTDTAADLYLAGMAAALLTGEKRPLIFTDGYLADELRQAFSDGLREQGFPDEPVFWAASSNYSSYPDIGCIVVAGPAARFLEQNLDIPVILFTWADPAMTPRTVKLVFDDSPWTMAADALKLMPGEIILLPSSPSLLRDRIEEKGLFRKLRGLVQKR